MKADVLKELPDKTVDLISCEMTGNQRRTYENLKIRLKQERDRCATRLMEYKIRLKERNNDAGLVLAEGVKRTRAKTENRADDWIDDETISRKTVRKKMAAGQEFHLEQRCDIQQSSRVETNKTVSTSPINLANKDDVIVISDDDNDVVVLKEVSSCGDIIRGLLSDMVADVAESSYIVEISGDDTGDDLEKSKKKAPKKCELLEIAKPSIPNGFMLKALFEFRKAACHPLLMRTIYDDEKLKTIARRILKVFLLLINQVCTKKNLIIKLKKS